MVTSFISGIINNTLPDPVRKLLAGTNYSTFQYHHNPNKFRMVGSLDSLIKIASNYMINDLESHIKHLANDTMADYAVAHSHSLSKYYHRLNVLLNEPNTDHIAMQLDIKGAYPHSSRPHIRNQLQIHLP